MATINEERYLVEIWRIENINGEVSINDLSLRLKVKMPSVNSMVKRLFGKAYIDYKPYKPIRLTELGRKEALLVLRKHRLTEMFLCQIMEIGWEHVHTIAEQIEHIKSPLFFNKIDSMLNHPTLDPHGEPIPDINGVLVKQNHIKLCKCEVGDKLIIRTINNKSEELLSLLNKKGISLNCQVEVISIEDYDGSFTLKCNNNEIFLSSEVAERVMVEKRSPLK